MTALCTTGCNQANQWKHWDAKPEATALSWPHSANRWSNTHPTALCSFGYRSSPPGFPLSSPASGWGAGSTSLIVVSSMSDCCFSSWTGVFVEQYTPDGAMLVRLPDPLRPIHAKKGRYVYMKKMEKHRFQWFADASFIRGSHRP